MGDKHLLKRLSTDMTEEKRHYKLYKNGKAWVTAGISLLFAGTLMMTKPAAVHADVVKTTVQTPAQTIATVQNQTAPSKDSITFGVQLAPGLKAPEWVAGDFTSVPVEGQTDRYTLTLSAQGLAALQAANPAMTIAENQIAAGTLTVAAPDKTQEATATPTTAQSTDTTAAQQPVANIASAETPKTMPAAQSDQPQSEETTNLGDATPAEVDAAKTKAAAAYQTTNVPQKVAASAGVAATSATGKVTLSSTKVGYGSGLDKLTITYTMTDAEEGDDFAITLPANSSVLAFQGFNSLASAVGTTTKVPNADGTLTVTNHFTMSVPGTTVQTITYTLNPNALGQASPISDVGTSIVQVSYVIDGVDQGSQNLEVTVNPTARVKAPARTDPTTNPVKAVLPSTHYVYTFAVNENTGVRDDSDASGAVNSAVNYGTTITIPVPAGFTLDEAATAALNQVTLNSGDTTTITQPGGTGKDIIITVPKGKGAQNWNNVPGYKLVGQFDTTQQATDQTLTAAGPAVVAQKTDETGTTKTFTADAAWTETILGTDSTPTVAGNVGAFGNNSKAATKLVLDSDPTNDPSVLNSFSFNYQSPSATPDAKITLDIPDGLDATSVSVPVSGDAKHRYLPGTTEYVYTMTLADGTTATGTVAAGGTVKPQAASAIRSIVFTPNILVPGASSDDKYSDGSFQVYGTLASKYDDGTTSVQNGDVLSSKITLAVPGTADVAVSQVDQTVSTPVSTAKIYPYILSSKPGDDGMQFDIYGTDPKLGQTTNKIYEPIIYYVLPSVTAVESITGTQDARVTQSLAPDGRVIVTIDYTGTEESVDLGIATGSNNVVKVRNNADALPGTYPYAAYIYSPNTALMQTALVPDPALAGGHADAVVMDNSNGNGNLTIAQATTTYESTLAQGDDIVPVSRATADKNSTSQLKFITNLVNTNDAISDLTVVTNIPTKDESGSQYTFNLTGAITVPKDFTTSDGKVHPLTATVLYSTQPASLTAGSTSPELTGYVPADQVTVWSKIRSVIVKIPNMPSKAATGRLIFNGTIPDLINQGGRIGYIASGYYKPDGELYIPKQDKMASLAITGTSTIHARAHYVDKNGRDKYLDFTDLDKTLKDNVDTLVADEYPSKQIDLSAADQALIPNGYKLQEGAPVLFDGGKNDGVAVFGQTVINNFDGDYAQYELVSVTPRGDLTITYVDDDAKGTTVSVAVTTQTTISGEVGEPGKYTVVVPDKYKLAPSQRKSIDYQITADDTDNITVHLVHNTVLGDSISTKQTVHYIGLPADKLLEDDIQSVQWTVTTDSVTDVTTYTPQTAIINEVIAPSIAGYTAAPASVSSSTLAATTTKPTDKTVTITYTANSQTMHVNYIDDLTGDIITNAGTTFDAVTGQTGTYTAVVPSGYVLAEGQDASVAYTTGTTDEFNQINIHLTHAVTHATATTTRKIIYIVMTGDQTKAPQTVVQTVEWKIVADVKTGTMMATPTQFYKAVKSPDLAGYTVDTPNVSQEVLVAKPSDALTNETVAVHYVAGKNSLTVTYIDDVTGKPITSSQEIMSGLTDDTGTYDVKIPDGYVPALGQELAVPYHITADTSDNLTIHLTHTLVHSTFRTKRTIIYQVNGDATVPAPIIQSIEWKTITDVATGQTYATALNVYGEVTSPPIPGYTPRQATVAEDVLGTVPVVDLKDTTVTVT